MIVELMTSQHEEIYNHFSQLKESNLIYMSLPYRSFLKRILTNAEDSYFLAFDHGNLVGALPTFLYQGDRGAVINSLPFYGSCGGLMVHPQADNPEQIRAILFDALDQYARSRKAVSTTLISNPLDPEHDYYLHQCKPSCIDERIGQITRLPSKKETLLETQDALMKIFHTKTRNMVRKAMKYEFRINHSVNEVVMRQLHEIHTENMKSIGGKAKEWDVFSAISEIFNYGTQYRVYYAECDDGIVAALLLLYFNQTVEYFTPVVRASHRSCQPLSLLIYEAMLDACQRNYRYWNWGGTWLSQNGVYLFKHRWGAEDFSYKYYIQEYTQHGTFRNSTQEMLLASYPFFFTIPFDRLEGNK